jgi:hypothetical protein
MTALPSDVKQAAVPVVFGFKEPGRVVEWIAPRGEEDRLDGGEGPADSWAHAGSQAA